MLFYSINDILDGETPLITLLIGKKRAILIKTQFVYISLCASLILINTSNIIKIKKSFLWIFYTLKLDSATGKRVFKVYTVDKKNCKSQDLFILHHWEN